LFHSSSWVFNWAGIRQWAGEPPPLFPTLEWSNTHSRCGWGVNPFWWTVPGLLYSVCVKCVGWDPKCPSMECPYPLPQPWLDMVLGRLGHHMVVGSFQTVCWASPFPRLGWDLDVILQAIDNCYSPFRVLCGPALPASGKPWDHTPHTHPTPPWSLGPPQATHPHLHHQINPACPFLQLPACCCTATLPFLPSCHFLAHLFPH